MLQKDEIEHFLNDLKEKIKVFKLIDQMRLINQETLAELELVPSDYEKYIFKLTFENYYQGPVKDYENGGEYWEFGIMIKNREIYIKINYGLPRKPVILISFHIAKFKINYPLKNKS